MVRLGAKTKEQIRKGKTHEPKKNSQSKNLNEVPMKVDIHPFPHTRDTEVLSELENSVHETNGRAVRVL